MSSSFKDDLNTVFGGQLEGSTGAPDIAACPGCGKATVSEEFLKRTVFDPLMVDAHRAQMMIWYRSGELRFHVSGAGAALMREGASGLCVICIHRGQMNAPGYEVQNL